MSLQKVGIYNQRWRVWNRMHGKLDGKGRKFVTPDDVMIGRGAWLKLMGMRGYLHSEMLSREWSTAVGEEVHVTGPA